MAMLTPSATCYPPYSGRRPLLLLSFVGLCCSIYLFSFLVFRTDRRPPIPFFFFNDTATTEIYTLSLHDALPISRSRDPARDGPRHQRAIPQRRRARCRPARRQRVTCLWKARTAPFPARMNRSGPDRKSTRLNSSHQIISYAVFCLKNKKKTPSRA